MTKCCGNCSKPISATAERCRSCAQQLRWNNSDEARREKLRERNRSARTSRPYEDCEWLRSRYEGQRMSMREIAAEAGCGLRTIARWIAKHGIKARDNRQMLRERRKLGEDNPNWRDDAVKRKTYCECGNPKAFAAKGCHECRDFVGEKNPNWRGIGDVRVLLRQWYADYWRPLVFRRDNFTCRRCGDSRGGNLQAHHIMPVAKLIDMFRQDWGGDLADSAGRLRFITYLLKQEQVTSLENGMTLCKDCHESEHALSVKSKVSPSCTKSHTAR